MQLHINGDIVVGLATRKNLTIVAVKQSSEQSLPAIHRVCGIIDPLLSTDALVQQNFVFRNLCILLAQIQLKSYFIRLLFT